MGPKIRETCGFNTGLARDLQLDPSPSLSAPTYILRVWSYAIY